MYICHCNVITSGDLAEAIAAGARTTKAVAQATSAGAVCGRCVASIAAMIKEETAEPLGRPMDQ
jgi:bacterioferritin-associated ferredoxin